MNSPCPPICLDMWQPSRSRHRRSLVRRISGRNSLLARNGVLERTAMSSPAKKAPRAQSLVEKIVSSSLTRHGGFGVVDAPMGYSAEKMLAEADRVFSSACETDVSDPDDEEMRGGNPARRFFSATAGPVQDAFYQNSEVARLLSRVAGVSLCPAGAHGTYSYYFRAGDYLSIHRDVEVSILR